MCDYTDRRSDNDSWECPCPYRDRCERFSRNNEGTEYNSRNNGCGEGRSGRNRTNGCGDGRTNGRRNGCSICNLFRGCNR